MKCTRKRNGFTLIEVLILVIILGILAAIVLPQFSSASPAAGNNGFSELADSQKDSNASDISPADENNPRVTNSNQQFNSSQETSSAANNPSHPIESASARTDESR